MKIIIAISEFAEKVFIFAILLLGVPCSISFLIFGNASINNKRSLKNEGVITNAAVTNVRVDAEEEVGYDIQYQFRVGDDGIWYSFADETGRHNLWYAPTKEEWEIIKQTKLIKVAYLPNDPWVNRPLGDTGEIDAYGGLIFGILLGVLWLWLFIVTIKNMRDSRQLA
jgi:hypothetical protein